jgi:hypothetical protein
MRTLARLGLEPVPFDTTPFSKRSFRFERLLQHRINSGRAIMRLNRALQAVARTEPFDAVWIDKGVWIYPETLAALKSAARRKFAVHYTPDAQLLDNRSRHFNGSIPLYDLLVTTKRFEIEVYKAMGARQTLLVLQGYGKQFVPSDPEARDRAMQSEVCFIGHCQRHYAVRLRAASSATGGLRVWGPRWPRYARFHPWARTIVQGNGLWGASYPRALRSAKIALGLLSKLIPETTTTRTFEIPATGVFMLAGATRMPGPVRGQGTVLLQRRERARIASIATTARGRASQRQGVNDA